MNTTNPNEDLYADFFQVRKRKSKNPKYNNLTNNFEPTLGGSSGGGGSNYQYEKWRDAQEKDAQEKLEKEQLEKDSRREEARIIAEKKKNMYRNDVVDAEVPETKSTSTYLYIGLGVVALVGVAVLVYKRK